ncbi:MAG: TolB family protein [Actinomycetota bacterium]
MRTWLRRIAIVGTAAASTFAFAAPAHASFPGQDGVAFARFDGSDATVHTMDLDGTGLKTPVKALGAMFPRFLSASLSPDGTKIVYARAISDTNIDLFVKTIGGGVDRITNTDGIWEYSASWAPSGKRIVFAETDDASYGRVAVMKADGTNYVPIFTSPIGFVWYPSWSPDGTYLIFSTSDGGDVEVFIGTPFSSTKVAALTDNGVDDYAGDWSPNGGRIAFVRELGVPVAPTFGGGLRFGAPIRRGPGTLGDVYTMRSDGTHPFQVTDDTNAFGRVIYGTRTSLIVSRLAHGSLDLYSVSTGGGGFTRLTRTSKTYNVVDFARYVIGTA